MAKDMLFATLDPTMRRVVLSNGLEVILSDTVGFISDLPTELVAAFRATLEEVLGADLIVHVRDIAHPGSDEQARDVLSILSTLGVSSERPLLEVWNKIDQFDGDERDALRARAARDENIFAVSALTGEGIPDLLDEIAEQLQNARTETVLHLSFEDGRRRAWLFEQDVVQEESQTENGFEIRVLWSDVQKARYDAL